MDAWKELKSDDGRVYYWNRDTNKTQWEPPEGWTSENSSQPRLVENDQSHLKFNLVDPNTQSKQDNKKEGEDKKEISITGYQARIFRNDKVALRMDSGAHLTPWNGQETIKIDRFDVRAMLSGPKDLEKNLPDRTYAEDEVSESIVERERYIDYLEWKKNPATIMEVEEEPPPPPTDPAPEEVSPVPVSADAAGGLGVASILTADVDNAPSSAGAGAGGVGAGFEVEAKAEKKFVPSFHVPPGVIPPSSLGLHKVIEKTVGYVVKAGGQAEVVLKVRQQDNPLFDFLKIDDKHYPYYMYLKESGVRHDETTPAPEDVIKTVTFTPGRIGFQFRGPLVTKVHSGSQADSKGIQPGWRLMNVDGNPAPVSTSEIITVFRSRFNNNQSVAATFRTRAPGSYSVAVVSSLPANPGGDRAPVVTEAATKVVTGDSAAVAGAGAEAGVGDGKSVKDEARADYEDADYGQLEDVEELLLKAIEAAVTVVDQEGPTALKGLEFLLPFTVPGAPNYPKYLRTLARRRARTLAARIKLAPPPAPAPAPPSAAAAAVGESKGKEEKGEIERKEEGEVLETGGGMASVETITPEEAMREIERARRKEMEERAEKEARKLKRRLERQAKEEAEAEERERERKLKKKKKRREEKRRKSRDRKRRREGGSSSRKKRKERKFSSSSENSE
ncbi:hypothetical protein AAMO2058_000563300 [Amorphochlora amoebiformis]